jgi:hypothetical protein
MEKVMRIPALTCLLCLLFIAPTLVLAEEFGPTIAFLNLEGTWDDEFLVYQTVYVEGTGYSSEADYAIYLVPHQEWVDGMAIPEAVEGTLSVITSDVEGNVPATAVWEPYLTVGEYDVVVDINDNGVYDAQTDVADEMRVRYALGLQSSKPSESIFAVPGLPFGTILAVLAFLMAFGLYRRGLKTPRL